jgi:capsular polysaccharide biosynthesis protein
VNDKDHSVALRRGDSNGLPDRLWLDDDFVPMPEGADADFNGGLASVGYVKSALGRAAWVWCGTAVLGLVIGLGLLGAAPPAAQATTTILITHSPIEDPVAAMETDTAMAQSDAVAGRAIRQLGSHDTPVAFDGTYTATTVTERILTITARAPSGGAAIRAANVVAAQFLAFRASQLNSEQQQTLASLNQQITAAKQHVAALATQITAARAQPSSPAQHARIVVLQSEHNEASAALIVLEQTIRDDESTAQVNTAQQVKGSRVIEGAVLAHRSHLKLLVEYGGAGLAGGLALGLGLVAVRAMVSDRLRRRDDVARALGVPVKLSVRAVRISRWLPSRRGLAAAQGREMRRIVAHLRGVLARSVAPKSAAAKSGRAAKALAVVCIDNVDVAALSVVSLAVATAQQGKRVVVADLSDGAHAARLLGVADAGLTAASVGDVRLQLAVPDRDDFVPSGPLNRTSPWVQLAPPSEALVTAYESADLLLTLVSLDPAIGADHLRTWASDVVAMVTAGRSSVTKVQAVGEMLRLAGSPLASAVLIGADKSDESLGVTEPPGGQAPTTLGDVGFASR